MGDPRPSTNLLQLRWPDPVTHDDGFRHRVTRTKLHERFHLRSYERSTIDRRIL